jgi:hypothetical protein
MIVNHVINAIGGFCQDFSYFKLKGLEMITLEIVG